jgi:hypothetical protein
MVDNFRRQGFLSCKLVVPMQENETLNRLLTVNTLVILASWFSTYLGFRELCLVLRQIANPSVGYYN